MFGFVFFTRQAFLLIGLMFGAFHALAITATGFVRVTIVEPVAVISAMGGISVSVSASTGWVALSIPISNFYTASLGMLTDTSGTSAIANTSINTKKLDYSIDAGELVMKSVFPGSGISDGTLRSDLATWVSLAVLSPGDFSATVAFN